MNVLNDFIEEPLLKSLKKAKGFSLFHDETTDVSNHSEAAIFLMFLHKNEYREHFFGIINMSPC